MDPFLQNDKDGFFLFEETASLKVGIVALWGFLIELISTVGFKLKMEKIEGWLSSLPGDCEL